MLFIVVLVLVVNLSVVMVLVFTPMLVAMVHVNGGIYAHTSKKYIIFYDKFVRRNAQIMIILIALTIKVMTIR